MAKKKGQKSGFSKWKKVLAWILGVFVGLVVLGALGLKIWVSTWRVDQQRDFSIKYPQGWYTGYGATEYPKIPYSYFITTPPKITKEAVDFSNSKLWIQIDVIRKDDIKSKEELKYIDQLILDGRHLGNGYCRFSLPNNVVCVTYKNSLYYMVFINSKNEYLPKNVFRELSYLLNGILVVLTLQ